MNKATVSGYAALAMLAVLPMQADAQCTYLPVLVHIHPNELRVSPPDPKCIRSNSTFIIRVTPPGREHKITVKQKPNVPFKIKGDNSANPDEVVVEVLGGVDGDLYGYIITVDGHGMLDPEVRVVESRAFMRTQTDEADALLQEELGISLQEASDTLRELNATKN